MNKCKSELYKINVEQLQKTMAMDFNGFNIRLE